MLKIKEQVLWCWRMRPALPCLPFQTLLPPDPSRPLDVMNTLTFGLCSSQATPGCPALAPIHALQIPTIVLDLVRGPLPCSEQSGFLLSQSSHSLWASVTEHPKLLATRLPVSISLSHGTASLEGRHRFLVLSVSWPHLLGSPAPRFCLLTPLFPQSSLPIWLSHWLPRLCPTAGPSTSQEGLRCAGSMKVLLEVGVLKLQGWGLLPLAVSLAVGPAAC